MYKIKFIGVEKNGAKVSVNGKEIFLTCKCNPTKKFTPEVLSEDIERLEQRLNSGQPLNIREDFTLPNTNIFQLIDALFFDVAINFWRQICFSVVTTHSSPRYRTALSVAFGVIPYTGSEKTTYQSLLIPLWHEVKNEAIVRPPKRIVRLEAKNERYTIRRQEINNNIITYSINDRPIEFCLSRNGALIDAGEVLMLVSDLDSAITERDQDRLLALTGANLSSNVRSVIRAFFMDETREFFCDIAWQDLYTYRQKPTPSKLLKKFFGPKRDDVYIMLLDTMELLFPEMDKYLIDSTQVEISTDKDIWILYDRSPNRITQAIAIFKWKDTLNSELRAYLRNHAAPHIRAGNNFAYRVSTKQLKIATLLNVLYDELGIHLDSMLELTAANCLSLYTYCTQTLRYSVKNLYVLFSQFRAFYNFVAGSYGAEIISPFKDLSLPKLSTQNHTSPATKEAAKVLLQLLMTEPKYFRLAFFVSWFTGGRASSVCLLKTTQIQKQGNDYVLSIHSFKTEISKTQNGLPVEVRHIIPEWLALELLAYIDETQPLRDQLDEPYVFVYSSPTHREGSKRQPTVLTDGIFSYEVRKLMASIPPIYHTNGVPVTVTFASIRAMLGRMLFADGCSASQVASFLGNLESTAAVHYNTKDAYEEANQYSAHYQASFGEALEIASNRRRSKALPKKDSRVTYGTCGQGIPCPPHKDCARCSYRAICKASK